MVHLLTTKNINFILLNCESRTWNNSILTGRLNGVDARFTLFSYGIARPAEEGTVIEFGDHAVSDFALPTQRWDAISCNLDCSNHRRVEKPSESELLVRSGPDATGWVGINWATNDHRFVTRCSVRCLLRWLTQRPNCRQNNKEKWLWSIRTVQESGMQSFNVRKDENKFNRLEDESLSYRIIRAVQRCNADRRANFFRVEDASALRLRRRLITLLSYSYSLSDSSVQDEKGEADVDYFAPPAPWLFVPTWLKHLLTSTSFPALVLFFLLLFFKTQWLFLLFLLVCLWAALCLLKLKFFFLSFLPNGHPFGVK